MLAAFHDATNGPGWTNTAGWLSGAPLNEWHGVRTDDDGRVTELALAGNGLSGPIPAELGLLVRLASLDLSGNGLSGPVPAALGNLEGLGVLNLGDNDLRGLVPPDWTRLSRLEILRLDGTGVCAPPDEEFQSWLQGIADRHLAYCEDPDWQALAALYHAMNGPGWKNAAGWLSDAPLGEWQGVTTDENGRVITLELEDDFLWGYIPPELGRLDMLRRLSLRGDFRRGDAPPGNALPPELGDLANLEELILTLVFLHGAVIPPELGKLQRLEKLYIYRSALSGPIPPELGKLSNLKELAILYNSDISSPIPSTLGNLERLEQLSLFSNSISGRIPPELGKLVNLEHLVLGINDLTGPIPPELGGAGSLKTLNLYRNNLTGPIPPELGNLSNLRELELWRNQLTGPIPPELGNLSNLRELSLYDNALSGPIPPELGALDRLWELHLQGNRLSGPIPPELGNLDGLKIMNLNRNADLSGPLPLTLAGLSNLAVLRLDDTDLCAPLNLPFQSWLQSIPNKRVARCGSAAKTRAYLTQAVQSLDHPVPLVAGERALLRVFVTAGEQAGADLPPVRATFYHGGVPAHVVDAPGRAAAMPAEIDEGSLSASINAEVPAWVIRPGLQMMIEVDPDGAADPAAGAGGRLPETGRMAVEVIDMPPFNLTVVPFLQKDEPDRSVLDATAGLTAGDDLFRQTRDLLPVGEFSLKVRDYVWTSVDVSYDTHNLLRETRLVRTADGSDDYYMGITTGGGGLAANGFRYMVSVLDGKIIAHELGHNLSLDHAPCGDLQISLDPNYPYEDGTIGTWGYDFMTGTLVPPETPDLMCTGGPPNWISDYHFTRAIRFRQTETAGVVPRPALARALLLWGGVDESGALILEPAFVADAAPSAPPARGPYRLSGTDVEGRVLFSVAFGMDVFDDGEGGAFAFALPAPSLWAGRLSRIALSGPEGVAAISRAGDRATALLRDGAGRLRGILRDVPAASPATAARRALPEPGLEIVISRGVPELSSW